MMHWKVVTTNPPDERRRKKNNINMLVTHHLRLLLYAILVIAVVVNIETLFQASSLTSNNRIIPYYGAREMATATVSSSNNNNRTITRSEKRTSENAPLLHTTSTLDTTTLEDDPDNYVAGCLKISDDNHWLVEWLAYHYWALPLRRLIVLVDPRSKTSPIPIFDRYQSMIQIEYVNATNYHGYTRVNRDTDADRIHMGSHLAFVTSCLRMYKDDPKNNNVKWVMSIDTDEFIYINPQTRDPNHTLYRPKVPSIDQPGHILTFLKEEEERSLRRRADPCISMARIQMTQKESNNTIVEENVPDGLYGKDFLTLRFLKEEAASSAANNKVVLRGKNIVNLHALNRSFLYDNLDLTLKGSTHQIIYPYCTNMPKRSESLLLANHYPGTTEQYTFRSNDPRGRTIQNDNEGGGTSDDTTAISDNFRPWLQAFVSGQNEQDVRRQFLEGAGRTHSWPAYHEPNTSNFIRWCTIDNGCMPPILPGKRARAQKNRENGSRQNNKNNNNSRKPLIQVPPPPPVQSSQQEQHQSHLQMQSSQADVRAVTSVILRKLDQMLSELAKLNDKVGTLQEQKSTEYKTV